MLLSVPLYFFPGYFEMNVSLKYPTPGAHIMAQRVMNPTRIHEDAGLIPGLT